MDRASGTMRGHFNLNACCVATPSIHLSNELRRITSHTADELSASDSGCGIIRIGSPDGPSDAGDPGGRDAGGCVDRGGADAARASHRATGISECRRIAGERKACGRAARQPSGRGRRAHPAGVVGAAHGPCRAGAGGVRAFRPVGRSMRVARSPADDARNKCGLARLPAGCAAFGLYRLDPAAVRHRCRRQAAQGSRCGGQMQVANFVL